MKVAIGADHRGAEVLKQISAYLEQRNIEVIAHDQCTRLEHCDYPDIAYPVARTIATGQADRGILICGSGIGMCIAANKIKGVRAAPVHDEIGAEMSRRHNDTNVLCLAADLLGIRIIERIVDVWMNTAFEGGRHARRIEKITAIESGRAPDEVPSGDEPSQTTAALED